MVDSTDTSREKLKRVARYQRWMILLLLIWLGVQSYIISTYGQPRPIAEHLAILVVFLASAVSFFLLAKEFHMIPVAIIGILLIAVPMVWLLAMYAVNQSATRYLRQHGISVGFFGASAKAV